MEKLLEPTERRARRWIIAGALAVGLAGGTLAVVLPGLDAVKSLKDPEVTDITRESADGAFLGMRTLLKEDLGKANKDELLPLHTDNLIWYVDRSRHLYSASELQEYLTEVAGLVQSACPSCSSKLLAEISD